MSGSHIILHEKCSNFAKKKGGKKSLTKRWLKPVDTGVGILCKGIQEQLGKEGKQRKT